MPNIYPFQCHKHSPTCIYIYGYLLKAIVDLLSRCEQDKWWYIIEQVKISLKTSDYFGMLGCIKSIKIYFLFKNIAYILSNQIVSSFFLFPSSSLNQMHRKINIFQGNYCANFWMMAESLIQSFSIDNLLFHLSFFKKKKKKLSNGNQVKR